MRQLLQSFCLLLSFRILPIADKELRTGARTGSRNIVWRHKIHSSIDVSGRPCGTFFSFDGAVVP